MNISQFKTVKHTKPEQTITVDSFLDNVKMGTWEEQLKRIRTEKDPDKRKKFKEQLPCVTIGGTFPTQRNEKGLGQHSGFICVDIDNFTDRSALIQDPHTYALFSSASGSGIAVIVKINPDKHQDSYRWLSQYYFKTYGIEVDEAPKNVASARYVSSDPDLFINKKSQKAKTKAIPKKKVRSTPVVYTGDQVGEMVQEAVSRGINLTEDYDDWVNMGFAIANGFGESGRQYYHSLSSVSDKYDYNQADKKYTNLVRSASSSGITVGTFYYLLKQHGIKLPKPDSNALTTAVMAKQAGRSKDATAIQLMEVDGLPQEQAEALASEVYNREDLDLTTVADDPRKLTEALVQYLSMNYTIRKNKITAKMEVDGQPITDTHLNTIYLMARMAFNSDKVNKNLISDLIDSEMTETYNPITEFIDKNIHRQGSGNVDRLISTIETDTPNASHFIKKWLVSLIGAYKGHPVRSVLALCGGQNTGKTEWFRRLLPPELKPYYGESKLDAGKDDEILMTQKLILMDDEMGGKSKQDEKRFKELTSKDVFSLRLPYARHNEDFKRLAVLCGTSNDPQIINDPTGNTRIFPINVISINHELYNSIDKTELFMELFRLYESGFEWQLTRSDIQQLQDMSEDFQVINMEEELLMMYFRPGNAIGGYPINMTATAIRAHIENRSQMRRISAQKFGIALRKIFGDPKSARTDSGVRKCYSVQIIPQDEGGVVGVGTTPETPEDSDFPF